MKLNQKLMLGIFVVILCVGIFAFKPITERKYAGSFFESLGKENNPKNDVIVGYGWSTKDNSKEAVTEAVSQIKEKFGGSSPDYVMLFSTVGYNFNEILSEIKSHLGGNVKIYGGTSMSAVLTKDGYHVGEKNSLAMLAVSSKKITFGVGGSSLDNLSAREAGKLAIMSAIKNANKEGKLPKIVLMTAAPGEEESILLGIEDVIGKDIPIIGGSSADNDISGKWKQFSNNNIYSNGVTLTAIYTSLKVGWAYDAGYEKTEKTGIITKANGRVIYEINNLPAAEVYNRWTNGLIEKKLKTGGTILSETIYYPLARVIDADYANPFYISIHPLSVNLPEKSLTVFANVYEGEEILLMHGNWELLLNRAQNTPAKALTNGNIAPKDVCFGVYTYCAGTLLAVPEEERAKMPLLVNNVLQNKPFIGTFTFGEQGMVKGFGNVHGNLVNSMVVLAE